MIAFETLYPRRSFSGTFSSIHQSCSSLHSFFIERKSLEKASAGNIK